MPEAAEISVKIETANGGGGGERRGGGRGWTRHGTPNRAKTVPLDRRQNLFPRYSRASICVTTLFLDLELQVRWSVQETRGDMCMYIYIYIKGVDSGANKGSIDERLL